MASPKGGKTPFAIADHTVAPGKRLRLEIPIANLTSGTPISLPVVVHHGAKPGPAVWLSAAVHGDELCGVEIIRRVLSQLDARSLSGTLISVPIVNVHGFNTGDRYLPDRRDLNRSFPGSKRGSLASRIANLFMTEVVDRCAVGIDLHTGSDQRENLPQIRADLDDAPTRELAQAFGAPIAIHSRVRDGSLRQAATDSGATVLLYEAGEAGRFSENAIGTGVKGVLRVLHHLGVRGEPELDQPPVLISRTSGWSRAQRSGILQLDADLGDRVEKGDSLATIHDPFGKRLGSVRTRLGGIVIGATRSPLVNRGDAVAHVADVGDAVPA